MNNQKQHINLITAYLQGTLTDQQQRELNRLVNSGEIDLLDIKEMESLYKRMDSIDVPEPSSSLSQGFYIMLEEEKKQQKINWRDTLNHWVDQLRAQFRIRYLAYAFSIFIAGLLVGDLYAPISKQDEQVERLSSQVNHLREMMMISLLDDSSPIERLKAVNISNEIRSVDNRVAKALLHTLNNDSNINVRLAAVEALVRHGSNPEVRRELVNSITRQKSPIVQSALADAMLQLQEPQSVDEFKKLLDQNELDSTVRNKLENTIAALNS
ncbi:MAG: HEAT repeat domain-containing protein [Balneolaceae bacterium]|nr:HEAT repeat domain-containing protein [Balneolaceae bacterium]